MRGRMGRNQPIRRLQLGIREAVGHSLHSSHLEPVFERESDIDRVGAISRASKLGSALWRWRYSGDSSAAPSAFSALLRKAQRRTKIYRHHKDFQILQRVCKLVLSEWYSPNCKVCKGAGEFTDEKLRIVCQACEGLGNHRYSDMERMSALGISRENYAKWAQRIADVWLCLSGSDAHTAMICRIQLERN